LGAQYALAIIENLDPKKPSFRPSKWPRKLKLLKIVNCQNCQKIVLSQLEKVGGHRYPPWINPPSLGSNGLHCIDFPHQMRKFLLNLAPGEPLALVQELPCFDDSIKMDPLLSSALDMCVHNMIIGFLLYAVGVELCWCQLFCYV
jgi:hypothetical protein